MDIQKNYKKNSFSFILCNKFAFVNDSYATIFAMSPDILRRRNAKKKKIKKSWEKEGPYNFGFANGQC